jgi:hypothetical protein
MIKKGALVDKTKNQGFVRDGARVAASSAATVSTGRPHQKLKLGCHIAKRDRYRDLAFLRLDPVSQVEGQRRNWLMCQPRFEELTVHSHPWSEVVQADSLSAKAEQVHWQRIHVSSTI